MEMGMIGLGRMGANMAVWTKARARDCAPCFAILTAIIATRLPMIDWESS